MDRIHETLTITDHRHTVICWLANCVRGIGELSEVGGVRGIVVMIRAGVEIEFERETVLLRIVEDVLYIAEIILCKGDREQDWIRNVRRNLWRRTWRVDVLHLDSNWSDMADLEM